MSSRFGRNQRRRARAVATEHPDTEKRHCYTCQNWGYVNLYDSRGDAYGSEPCSTCEGGTTCLPRSN